MRRSTLNLVFIFLLCLRLIPATGAEPANAGDGCTLTITGVYTASGERIDLAASNDPYVKGGPIFLALTNLTSAPLTYTFHSTGAFLKWEFDVDGTIHRCETVGQGSGVWLSKTLQPTQSGVIPTTLWYLQLPKKLRSLIVADKSGVATFVNAKVRVTLSIDAKPHPLTVISDWTPLKVGSTQRPQDADTWEAIDKSAAAGKE